MNRISGFRDNRTERKNSHASAKTSRCIVAIFAAHVCTASIADAQVVLNCPTVTLPAELDNPTQKCLNDLEEIFNLDTHPRKTRNSLLWLHDRADQSLVIAVMYAKYCRLLEEQGTNQSQSELEVLLERVHSELYERESISPIISDSRDTASLPANYPRARAFRVRAASRLTLAASKADTSLYAPSTSTSTSRSQKYLRDSPYVVNNSNKYFVLVASVFSASDAVEEINRLKSKAPQYDFVAYAPYQGNPAYAIMMATWVSKEVAYMALEDARRDVADDAFVWMCPQKGEKGTC